MKLTKTGAEAAARVLRDVADGYLIAGQILAMYFQAQGLTGPTAVRSRERWGKELAAATKSGALPMYERGRKWVRVSANTADIDSFQLALKVDEVRGWLATKTADGAVPVWVLPEFGHRYDSYSEAGPRGQTSNAQDEHSDPPSSGVPAPRRVLAQMAQEDAIVAALTLRGHDPLRMPKAPLGNKPWPLREEIRRDLGPAFTKEVMRKAWLRLRKAQRIRDA